MSSDSGLLTPAAAALSTSAILIAVVSAHVKHGFFLTNGRHEYPLIIGAITVGVACTGPGVFSLDRAFGLRVLDTAYGVGAIGIPVIGGLASSRSLSGQPSRRALLIGPSDRKAQP